MAIQPAVKEPGMASYIKFTTEVLQAYNYLIVMFIIANKHYKIKLHII